MTDLEMAQEWLTKHAGYDFEDADPDEYEDDARDHADALSFAALLAKARKEQRKTDAKIARKARYWTKHPYTNDKCWHWHDGQWIAAAIMKQVTGE